jgi:hypothetical protein
VLLVLAIFALTNELMRLDLPTLERPRKATSGNSAGGKCSGENAESRNLVKTFLYVS